jgi:peroxiredoxin Q/BCP
MALKENMQAPEFTLANQDGQEVRLKDFREKWVLVYFYPKDDTPGCTVEAKGMQDHLKMFDRLNFEVLGISPDRVAKHRKFADKYGLQFNLLADEEKKVVRLYGVWGKKKFMGREYMGVNRSSFLIEPGGRIAKIYPKVKPDIHPREVYQDVQKLASS